jgi:hypothetical protein
MSHTTETTTEFPQLLTPAEAASILRVTPTTLARWADAGRLVRVKFSERSSRYTRASVAALIDGEDTS